MFKLSNLLLLKLLIVVGYLLCAIESSNFVEAVQSVVEAVDCCRLLYLIERSSLFKLLNLLLLKLLIVVGYYML